MKKTSEKITDQESVRHLRQRFHCSLAGASVDAHSTSLAYKSVIVTVIITIYAYKSIFTFDFNLICCEENQNCEKKNINYMCNVISTKVCKFVISYSIPFIS